MVKSPTSKPPAPLKRLTQPLDRTAILLMLVLSIVISLLLLKGDRTAARVRDFSWQDRQVGAEDTAFILAFSRPMDHASVENNLRIEPPLPGKFSWAGRRMAYTLETPVPYGKTFELTLTGARDRFSSADDPRTQMRPFMGQFRSRNRAFVYLGVEGQEAGRLVLQNLTQQEKRILTPETLVVMDFEPYPEGDRILFSATERAAQNQGILDQQLYTVTTGISVAAPAPPLLGVPSSPSPVSKPDQPPGIVELVLDSREYQNLKFDLSPDGKTIAVQRVNRQNPADFGLWLVRSGQPPQQVNTDPGGDFLIAPDSQSIAMSQGQGMAILPLDPQHAETLDFLPKYGVILSFARDGSAAAMVKFNSNPQKPTRSLFLVTNQGNEKELLTTDGSILFAEFDAAKRNLYCLYTKRLDTEEYLEEPYLAAIALETTKVLDLLRLPIQRDIQVSLAPDNLGILFDQTVTSSEQTSGGLFRSSDGKAITSSQLWFLPIVQDAQGVPQPTEPEALGIKGIQPRWLP
ncbi:MAG: hypothetical protein IGS38_23705 [Synechococcales cyanobacterium M58_A2018_015]|nr:hypothetical protein [Synechococcales cyanobacterium M58_A2018_015]